MTSTGSATGMSFSGTAVTLAGDVSGASFAGNELSSTGPVYGLDATEAFSLVQPSIGLHFVMYKGVTLP